VKKLKKIKLILFISTLLYFLHCSANEKSLQATKIKSWPKQYNSWDPENTAFKKIDYPFLKKAKNKWKVCVSIPHLKDSYWLAVNYALVDHAKKLGVRMRIKQAGGYTELLKQRTQIKTCMDSGADALILSSVDTEKLNDLISDYTNQNKVVIDLINYVNTTNVSGRVAVNYYDNGKMTAEYLSNIADDVRVLWLPGPKGPGWPKAADKGFLKGLKNKSIEVVETLWGDTGYSKQYELIKSSLLKNKNIDYIVGNTVAAEAAVDIVRQNKAYKHIEVMSYYYSKNIHRALKRKQIVAAASDKQAQQAKLALDLAVRLLEEDYRYFQIAPIVEIVDSSNLNTFDSKTSISPRGFRPIFSVSDWKNNDE